MKKIIDFLRNIGLLHLSKGDFQTGEFDKRSDIKKEKKIEKSGNGKASSNKKYLIIFMVIGFIMMFLFLAGAGFTFWFLIMFVLWIWFLWSIKKWISLGTLVVKKTITIGILMVFLTFMFMGAGADKEDDSSKSGSEKSSTENVSGSSGHLYQESYSAEMSASNQFSDSGTNTKTVSMWIGANVRMYTPDQYKKVSIKNVALKNDLKGDVRLLIPAGGYSEKLSKSNEIEYEVVEKSAMKPGTVEKNMAYMSIQVKTTDAFKFDTNKAFKMSKAGIGPSKTFQYVGLDASDLDNTLEFDVAIEFESGEKKVIHFLGKIEGEEFLETGGIKNVKMEVLE